jgi:acyl carrier protein
MSGVREMIRGVWEQALNAQVTDEADFFLLGGNSLHAMSICSGIEEAVHFRPRLRVIFDHPRFGDYAQEISAMIDRGRA